MKTTLHHAHLFASNLDISINFYKEMFGAEILFDLKMAGARNVMISIGTSKINFYDQPPKDKGRGAIHHLGIETDDLEGLVTHMKKNGFQFIKEIKNFGPLKYVMAAAPDNVLLELFQVVKEKISEDQFNQISSLNSL
ncbi:MAG: VOC family protein [Promethearchaeota archaeon]